MARKIDVERRKQIILAKAMKLFSSVGYDNVSLIMIAEASGIARTALYRYYCSKREVLDAAILETTKNIMNQCRAIMAGNDPIAVQLEKICDISADKLFENREFLVAVYDFVIGMVRSGAVMSGRIYCFTMGIRKAFVQLIDAGKSNGEFVENIDTARTADLLYSFFESFTLRLIIGTEHGPAAVKARFKDTILGIKQKG